MLVFGSGVGAVYASDSAVPGDFLYSIDRAAESAQMSLTRGPDAKAELELEFLNERVAELDEVVESEGLDSDLVEDAVDEVEKSLAKAWGRTDAMIEARENGNVSEVVHQRVLQMQLENTLRHEEKLNAVKDKVDEKKEEHEQARLEKKLENALEKTKKNKSQAKKGLGIEENDDSGQWND